MSAIWGCVDLSGADLPEGLSAAMEKPLHEYKIDRYASISDKNVVMGCGIQYITPEAEREPLPIYDKEAGIYFTADCMVDNRLELVAELCPGMDDIPDGELMFLAYKKWREDMPMHIRGAFSYAVYAVGKNQLIVGADHVLNRCIYYSRIGNLIYFSTLIEPIIRGRGGKPEINEVWIVMFLSITSLAVHSNPVDTPYKGINMVQASHYMISTLKEDRSVEYWSYKDVKPLRLNSKEEYKELFRSLLKQAASEAVRTSGEVGILLSSGLDSSTVAAFAEPLLVQEGKRLYSYTYVPIDTYKSRYNEKYTVTNEQSGVELLREMYPGITSKFLDVPEQNALSSIKRILPDLEVPYKSHTNVAWIDALANIASKDRCKIILTGQTGNATISAGKISSYILSRITHGRLIDAAIQANRYAKGTDISRKRFIQYILNELTPGFIKYKGIKDYWGASYINRDFARSVGVTNKDIRIERNLGIRKILTYEVERSLKFSPTTFAQVSEDETKLLLKHGMITRDITRDIRIFEFCLAVPMECSVGPEGRTRLLVRDYLSDKLPAKLIDEKAPKGRQSGDVLDRVIPWWNNLYPELVRVCRLPCLQKFIDTEMVSASLEKFRSPPKSDDEKEFVRLCAVYTIGVFLEIAESEKL